MLRLRCALTFTKIQGMTIDYIKIDFSGLEPVKKDSLFYTGLVYTAFSRARDLAGIQVSNLPVNPIDVKLMCHVHSKVRSYLEEIGIPLRRPDHPPGYLCSTRAMQVILHALLFF